jgi:hypothetical protein
MFVYGWASYTSIHWMAPTVGLAMVGFGTTAVIAGFVYMAVAARGRKAMEMFSTKPTAPRALTAYLLYPPMG